MSEEKRNGAQTGDADGTRYVRVDAPDEFPPQEDGYQRLWTPQRMSYVLRGNADDGAAKKPKDKECPFCAGPRKSDEDGLIAWRGTYVFAIMNLYPYNCGHLMICPYRHVSLLTDLDDDELFEFEKASALAMDVMAKVSRPDGWNLGINQGDVAGAGVATHLHQHIVPRWNGDANFMPIVAQTRTMPILLHEQREAYAAAFQELAPSHGLPAAAKPAGHGGDGHGAGRWNGAGSEAPQHSGSQHSGQGKDS